MEAFALLLLGGGLLAWKSGAFASSGNADGSSGGGGGTTNILITEGSNGQPQVSGGGAGAGAGAGGGGQPDVGAQALAMGEKAAVGAVITAVKTGVTAVGSAIGPAGIAAAGSVAVPLADALLAVWMGYNAITDAAGQYTAKQQMITHYMFDPVLRHVKTQYGDEVTVGGYRGAISDDTGMITWYYDNAHPIGSDPVNGIDGPYQIAVRDSGHEITGETYYLTSGNTLVSGPMVTHVTRK